MKNYSIFKHSFCTLSLFIVMLLHAGVTYAQEKLRISFSNVSLEEALKKIESASKYTFFYDDKRTDLSQKVSANANGQSIEEVLNAMLKTTNLTYEIDNRQIALIIKEKNGISQKSKKISGVVKDENNEPVIGVSIVQRNTTNGTITDLDGRFSMELPENSSIEISYVGYGKQIIPVANKSNFDIVLKENSLNLDEVVVVGYASRKVEDITGAVSNIRADKTNIGGASTSVDQMLSGRISGVQFKQNTSQPGGGGKTIIRGRNSLFLNTDPLYVVDGFVVNTPSAPSSGMAFNAPDRDPLNSINPNDIESIAVLKDAAATAIYGAQGSNGVFIITTKRGKQGKIRISYDGYAGVQTVANEYDVMNAQQYMRYNNAFNLTSFTEQEINAAQATNWFDQVTRNGFLQSHNVNLSGGSESLKYYFSLGYYGMDGIVKNTGMDRYTGRSNIEYKKDKFTFSSNIFATHILDTNQPTEGGTRNSVISSSIAFAPNVTVRDQNGAYNKDPNNDFIANPVSLLDINDKIYTDKLNFSAGASYEVLPGLKPEIKLTYDVQNAHRSFYVPSTTAYNGNFTHGGTASQSSMRSTGISFDGLLHYDAVFNKKHHVTGLLGYEYYQRDNNYFRAENSGFGTDATHENNLGGGNAPKMSSSKDRRKDISGFGRVDYSFDDKYLATVTLRRDGSSVFGGNNKYAYFPGVSVGWKIDKEDFMAGAADKVDILKLRLGYGQSGNSGIDPYQSLSKYDMTTNGILGQNKVSGATLTNYMENPDLTWETTSQVNLGIDYGFFSRLSGNLDFFGECRHFLDQFQFLRFLQRIPDHIRPVFRNRAAGFFDLFINAINPCMGVLDIVDRIFIAVGLCQVQIKIQLRIQRPHDEEIPCRIGPDFFNQFVQRNRLAGSFAHLHGLAVAERADHLQQQHFQLGRVIPESRHRRFDTGYVSMMIGAPDVDHFPEAPFIFILMIGNIRSQIRRYSVIADDNPVFVIAVIRRFQPEGTVFFVSFAPFF